MTSHDPMNPAAPVTQTVSPSDPMSILFTCLESKSIKKKRVGIFCDENKILTPVMVFRGLAMLDYK